MCFHAWVHAFFFFGFSFSVFGVGVRVCVCLGAFLCASACVRLRACVCVRVCVHYFLFLLYNVYDQYLSSLKSTLANCDLFLFVLYFINLLFEGYHLVLTLRLTMFLLAICLCFVKQYNLRAHTVMKSREKSWSFKMHFLGPEKSWILGKMAELME